MSVNSIVVYSISRLESKLAGLNRKAVKLGFTPITYQVVETVTKIVEDRLLDKHEVFDYYVVELSFDFEQIKLPGDFKLAGVLDHKENLVKSVPGSDVQLSAYLDRGPVCDHCGLDRGRNETFVLVGVGDVVQVGRSCLGSFLGISPAHVLGQIDLAGEVASLEDEDYRQREVIGTPLRFFLSHVVCLVRTAGWRSRSQAKEEGCTATADLARYNIQNQQRQLKDRYGLPVWEEPTASDIELAEKVWEWLRSDELATASVGNDYLGNLVQIGVNNYVTQKSEGFAASALVAYQKKVEDRLKKEGQPVSSYVCKVGERVTFNRLNLVRSSGFDTDYGYTFVHRFLDERGNVITWRTQTGLDLGEYKVTASVKAHEEYRGEKQTCITRAKVLKLEKEIA